MYALVIDNALVAVRNPGRVEVKLSDGRRLSPPEGGWTAELAALCGFVEIVRVARPVSTPTTTHDRTVELVAGVPTEVWTERAKTVEELAAAAAAANQAALLASARAAIDANIAFLDLASPTNAQTLAQVRTLTRESTALIRLLIGADLLATTEGT